MKLDMEAIFGMNVFVGILIQHDHNLDKSVDLKQAGEKF